VCGETRPHGSQGPGHSNVPRLPDKRSCTCCAPGCARGPCTRAAEGELRVALPAGYEYDAAGHVQIAADEAVADAIATVLAYFEQLGSARQVLLRLLAEERRLPRPARRRGEPVRWAAPTYRTVHTILTNPCYAGV
jgi:hypothetical protein